MTGPNAERMYRMRPLEIAAGYVWDETPRRVSELRPAAGSPRAALEASVRKALQDGRCMVAFSGGRDSSAILAVAKYVADRDALPQPIPITRRFPDFPETLEDEWQEGVIRHLGIEDWERLDLDGSSVDAIGPLAQEQLLRHGVVWPPTVQSLPVLEQARGGVLLDGEGGDQVFEPAHHRIDRLYEWRSWKQRWKPRRLLTLVGAIAPPPLQAAVMHHRLRTFCLPWLTEHALASWRGNLARQHGFAPLRWDKSVLLLPQRPELARGMATVRARAREHDVDLRSPFLEPGFLASFAHSGGAYGPGTRSEVMQTLFGDLLPKPILTRMSKASFNAVVFGQHSRRFAEEWDGEGVDTSLVRPGELRRAWLAAPAHGRSLPLLQQAWLRSGASS